MVIGKAVAYESIAEVYVKKRNTSGFTLLELLAVMAIILIMATIATTGYRAMISGTGISASLSHLRQAMELARQSAIMQGKSAFVVFYQDANTAWYVTCLGEGYNDTAAPQQIVDPYNAELVSLQVGSLLHNLSEPLATFSDVKQVEANGAVITVTCEDKIWSIHDRYGWEVVKRIQLPRGFWFKDDDPETIRFKPVGTATDISGSPFGGRRVEIYEETRPEKVYAIEVADNGLMKTIYK